MFMSRKARGYSSHLYYPLLFLSYLLCLHLLQVFFFRKQEPPTDREESMQFAKRLANIGMSLAAYKRPYNLDNEERLNI